MNLQELGFTKEELQQRVVDQAVRELFDGSACDDEGNVFTTDSRLHRQLTESVRKRVDEKINAIAEQHVIPKVSDIIDGLILHETNKWGEKIGKPLTFIEYLVSRAEHWIMEEVNYEGKAKRETDQYGWSAKATRLANMIHKHLAHSIEIAMTEAMKEATGSIARGIHETARIKLNEIAASLKVGVVTK